MELQPLPPPASFPGVAAATAAAAGPATPFPASPPPPPSPHDLPLPLWRSFPSSRPIDDTAGRACFCRLLIRLEMGVVATADGRQEEGLVPVIEQGDMEFLRLFRFLPYSALAATPSAAATASDTLLRGQRLAVLFGPATDLNRAQALLTACLRATTTGGEGAALLNLYTATRQVLSCRVTSRTLLGPGFHRAEGGGRVDMRSHHRHHCLLLITPVCFWAYCKHPKLFATLHPFSPTAPGRRPEDVVYESNGKRKRRRRPRQQQQRKQQQERQEQQGEEEGEEEEEEEQVEQVERQPVKKAPPSRRKKKGLRM